MAWIEHVLWAVRYQPVATMLSISVATAAAGAAGSAFGFRLWSEPVLRSAWFSPLVASITATSCAVVANLLEDVLSETAADVLPLLGVLGGGGAFIGLLGLHVVRGVGAQRGHPRQLPVDRPLALVSIAVLLVAALLWPGGLLDLGGAPSLIAGRVEMSSRGKRTRAPPAQRKAELAGQERIVAELQTRRAGGAATEGGDITALIWSSGSEPGQPLRKELASWVHDDELSGINRSAAALALAQAGERGHRSTVRRLARETAPGETEVFRRLVAALVELDHDAALRILRKDVGLDAPETTRASLPEWEARAHLLQLGTADASDTVAELMGSDASRASIVPDLPAAARTGGLKPGEALDRLMASMAESPTGLERVVACQVLSVWRPAPAMEPALDCGQWVDPTLAESQRMAWPAIKLHPEP